MPTTPNPDGGIGGLLLDRIGRRAVLRTMQCAIQRGLHVGDIGLGKAIATAEAIIDDEEATHRDKLRASEFLKAVTDKGIEVALHAEKGSVGQSDTPTAPVAVQIIFNQAQPPAPKVVE